MFREIKKAIVDSSTATFVNGLLLGVGIVAVLVCVAMVIHYLLGFDPEVANLTLTHILIITPGLIFLSLKHTISALYPTQYCFRHVVELWN